MSNQHSNSNQNYFAWGIVFFRQNYWLKFSILRAKINTFVFLRKWNLSCGHHLAHEITFAKICVSVMVMPDIFSAVTQSEEPQPHPFLASFLLCSAHCSNTTHRQYPWVRSSFPGFLMAHTLITHHFLPTLPPTRSDEFLVISPALQMIGFF